MPILSTPPEDDLEVNVLFATVLWEWAYQLKMSRIEEGYLSNDLTYKQYFSLIMEASQVRRQWLEKEYRNFDDVLQFQRLVADVLEHVLTPVQ